MMAAVMDLDLNCSPSSPEPAAQDDLNRSMLPNQVKDLHRLYWTHTNLTDVRPPFWKQSHPSHMVNFDDTGDFYGQDKQGFPRDYNGAAEDNLEVEGPVRRQPDPPNAQGMRSRCLYVIDLEKPAALDDDVEILSSRCFINYGTCNSFSQDNSQCVPLENSPVMGDLCRDHNTPYASHGSSGSSDTPDSPLPVRTKTTVSGRMFFDLNVAQEDDSNICPGFSKVLCSLSRSATRNSVGCCNNPSHTCHKGSESSIGSSKGSCVTVATTISAPDGTGEAMATGLFCDSQNNMPFCVETSKHNALVRGNMHHQQALDKNSKFADSQATNLTGQIPVAMHREPQEDTIIVISDTDSEMENFDLNIPVESIDLPSKVESNYGGKRVNSYGSEENSYVQFFTQNQGRQSISSVDCLTSRTRHMAENKADEDVRSPGSGIAINRSVLIPETPQDCDCACPRLSPSSNGVSIQPETACIHQAKLGEDEISAATAAETLVSIFATNSAWMTDIHGNNSQTDPTDGNHKPLLSLDSFEESILNLEEMEDDGESTLVRPPDKDTQSCGIKLKRGRGLRNFQREILPGLVSLARHEICDDLHAIGYEIRKNRSRRSSGEQATPPMRTRLPRRCSTAWNL